jgi:hypothetical protein
MLTIKNIQKLEGCKVAGKGVVWKIMKVNENDYKSDKIYTIVLRTYPDLNYTIHLYLDRELKDGDYHIRSSESNIKYVVTKADMVDAYNFLRLIKKEIERALC